MIVKSARRRSPACLTSKILFHKEKLASCWETSEAHEEQGWQIALQTPR